MHVINICPFHILIDRVTTFYTKPFKDSVIVQF